jgi:hypothetical protein
VLHNLSVCICGLRYPACNEHVPYCNPLHDLLYNNFSRYIIKGRIFEKKKLHDTMCVVIFSTTFERKNSNLKRNELDMIKNVFWSSCKVSLVLVRF